MAEFRTKYNRPRGEASNPGNPIVVKYLSRLDDSGNLVLEPSGKENLYDFIQASADSCSIDNIMRRYANGDTGVLSRVQGIYVDTVSAPKNFAELLNFVRAQQEAFDLLPADVKERFGNNFAAYAETAGSADWLKAMTKPDAPVVDVPDAPVVDVKDVRPDA